MIDYQPLVQRWGNTELSPWADILPTQIERRFNVKRYGDLPRWLEVHWNPCRSNF